MVKIDNDWDEILSEEFKKDYYLKLRAFLKTEYRSQIIYPPMHDIFNALRLTSCSDTKVVILGQDPYHGKNQAHGLSFSVKDGVALPPSLKNIYKEIESEYNIKMPRTGELTNWARQGVLLLNTALTVREGMANSHKGKGWETLTDEIIIKLNENENPKVFLLWGANARSKAKFITNKNHLVLQSVHPSPLSAHGGFFGCNHFKLANQFLADNSVTKIEWDKL